MSVVSDYPDYSQHVAHADQIAATGVPLLTKSTRLYQQATGPVAHGATVSTGALHVSQIGYEIQVTMAFPAGTVTPYVEIHLSWTDSATGFEIGTDSYIMPGATTGGNWAVHGHGPTKADELNLSVTNLDSAQACSGSIVVLQNSRVYPRDEWRWINAQVRGLTVPGITLPVLPDDESVLGMLGSVSVAAGSTSTFLFGMHNGLIGIGLDQGAGPWTNITLEVAPAPASAYVAGNPLYAAVSPPPNVQIAGPRCPLRVQLHNAATTAFTATMSLVAVS